MTGNFNGSTQSPESRIQLLDVTALGWLTTERLVWNDKS